MITLLFYQWDVGVGESWVVGVLVVDSFELYSIHFLIKKLQCSVNFLVQIVICSALSPMFG